MCVLRVIPTVECFDSMVMARLRGNEGKGQVIGQLVLDRHRTNRLHSFFGKVNNLSLHDMMLTRSPRHLNISQRKIIALEQQWHPA